MMTHRMRIAVSSLVAGALVAAAGFHFAHVGAAQRPEMSSLPARLSDQDFWRMVTDFSEPNGFFQSDNFASNETAFQTVIPTLAQRIRPDSVYLGVGPEQNFTYIVALHPRLAFIVDIRRQNLLEHLIYKAAFELSSDRASFLARLFSRQIVVPADRHADVKDLLEACLNAQADPELFRSNGRAIIDLLTKKHGFALSDDDLQQIAYVYGVFFQNGPGIQYSSGGAVGRGMRGMPTYVDLMLASDAQGVRRSYLASEENFAAMKSFERDNRLIPLVGDFAGPKAFRSVGQYVQAHGATVSVLYTSNVEQYLFQSEDNWKKFYANVAALPYDETSTFIRSCFQGCGGFSGAPFFRGRRGGAPMSGGGRIGSQSLLETFSDLLTALKEGKIQSYYDVIQRSK